MLKLAFATGTEPGKWFDRFRRFTAHGGIDARDADDAVARLLLPADDPDHAEVALARLPVTAGGDPRLRASTSDDFFVVRLYEEEPGIAVPKESVYAEVGEAVQPGDVAEEHVNYRLGADGMVDVDAVRAGLQVVAANVGVVIAPRPLLKVLSKKLVVPLGFLEEPDTLPRTEIALVWRKAADREAIQDFVGIAKGRTAASSRQERPKLSARDKAKAKQARREQASGGRGVGKPARNGKNTKGNSRGGSRGNSRGRGGRR